jgi:hypothetical protein
LSDTAPDLEEIMSIKTVIAVLALATLVTPAFADMPDGHGGRTSPQASTQNVAPATRSCCPSAAGTTARTPTSPAEVKAMGEVAWAARTKKTATAEFPCYKKATVPAPVYASSAELKALGHMGQSTAAGATARAACCEAQACPMRRAS